MSRCTATTKRGAACTFTATHDGLCTAHGASAGLPGAISEQKARRAARKPKRTKGRGRGKRPAQQVRPTTLAPIAEVGGWMQRIGGAMSAVFLAFVRAFYGVLTTDDLSALRSVVLWREWPRRGGYFEALLLAGRRSGKSSRAIRIALFEAIEVGAHHMAHLPPGTRGHILIVSRTIKQASETGRYAKALLEEYFPELLEKTIENQSGIELHLTNGITISIGPASSSSLRGFTILFAIVDEAAFLGGTDEQSERDLEEIVSVLRMSMLAPTGAPPRRLLVISSPGVKSGWVYDSYQRYAADPGAPMLVASGPSYVWNPTLDREQLERERLRDPRRYQREVEAQFVGAISPLLDDAAIDRAVEGRTIAPLRPVGEHVAAIDIGLRRDSTGLCVSHLEEVDGQLPRVVVDGVWRWSPDPGTPLDIAAVVRGVCVVLKGYSIRRLTSDQFSFDSVRLLFSQHDVELVEHVWTQPSKVQRFGVLRDLLIDNRLSLPAHERLLSELRSLDETILPSGTVRIAGRGRASDDLAFATCLCVSETLLNRPSRSGADWWAELAEADAENDGWSY